MTEDHKVIAMLGGVCMSALPSLVEVLADFFFDLSDDTRRASFFAVQSCEYIGDSLFFRNGRLTIGSGSLARRVNESAEDRRADEAVNTVRAVIRRKAVP